MCEFVALSSNVNTSYDTHVNILTSRQRIGLHGRLFPHYGQSSSLFTLLGIGDEQNSTSLK